MSVGRGLGKGFRENDEVRWLTDPLKGAVGGADGIMELGPLLRFVFGIVQMTDDVAG